MARRRAERAVKLDRPSLRSVLLAERQQTGIYRFVPIGAVAVVVIVLLVGIALRDDRNPNGGSDVEAAAAAVTTLPATTVAPVATPAPPLDESGVCVAKDRFVLAVSTLDPSQDQDRPSVVSGLQVISTALEGLGRADDHPDLVRAVETLGPLLNDALQAITSGSENLVTLVEDPRFADPAVAAAMGTIMSYPLNCPTPG